jgi:methylated-DNA-protein-cysteine methyltransferase related protein
MLEQYEGIYALVLEIPRGRVTTYGQLGAMCGIGDSRVVGEAMNASHGLPWQRVINSRGEISIRGATGARQRELLEQEGVEFDAIGRVDLEKYGWVPDAGWLAAHGYKTPPPLVKEKKGKEGDSPKGAGEQLSLF